MIGRMLTVAPTIGAPWPDRLEEECSKIFSVCERAIELRQPDLGFRESIIGAILQCYFAHDRRIHPKPVSGKVYWRVPADAVESSLHGNAMIIKVSIDELLWASETAAAYAFPKRKTGKKGREDIAGQPAFECLIMSLALAFVRATGRRPRKPSFNDYYERSYGPFWRLVEIVLPVASKLAEEAGEPLQQPKTEGARAQRVKRILKHMIDDLERECARFKRKKL